MSPSAGHHKDLGLQPERTWLAWRRTLLSLVAVSLLFLRWLPQHGRLALALVALALSAAGMIAAGQQRRYRYGVRAINQGRARPPVTEVCALALACTGLGALGLYVVIAF
ncbi:DUF202 domain-containing protein [Pseudomonas sp. RIT-PI-S]|uniref:DUF202 domain-containing protein n=1 Tax=Pseudomonas sp. RIT-PI-S TaxID=3035295 RepID=UPI0021DB51F6|nr:DUF202 domain-containing protein [Pseudomonas sp. RIT-PI-S]